MGIGIGLDGIDTKYYGFHNTFNLSGDVRYYLKAEHDGIFFHLTAGPSLKIDDNFENGLMINIGIGHKLTIGKSFILVPSLGYNHQEFKVAAAEYKNQTLAVKLGFLF